MTKTNKSVKLNMPTFVKRVRKTYETNRKKISADGVYVDGNKVCIIGAGLSKKQLQTIVKAEGNFDSVSGLINRGVLQVDKKYAERLENLQNAFDSGDRETVRLRLRHLEASVKKAYPKSFK